MRYADKIKKFWKWLWYSDSWASWLVSLILAFVIVRFVFFPLLSLIFATSLPLVVVESGSMHHPGGFIGNTIGMQNSFQTWWHQSSDWYEERGLTENQAENWPLRTGLEKGDIVVVTGYGKPEAGDIIIFNANQAHPIIHRIINTTSINGKAVYSTKGDNNPDQLYVEKQIPQDALIGKAVLRIPKLGWLKLAIVNLINAFR
jgi:signal peptidase I